MVINLHCSKLTFVTLQPLLFNQPRGGAAERQFHAWRAVLQRSLAHAEAVIDFGDDDDEEDVDADAVFAGLLPEV